MKKLFTAVVLIFLFSFVQAATISGTAYNWVDLEPLTDVVIDVNSEPRQLLVAKDGNYALELSAGDYTIKAFQQSEGYTLTNEEMISITGEGNYTLDLILLPNIEVDVLEELTLEDEDINEELFATEEAFPELVTLGIIVLGLLIIMAVLIEIHRRKKEKTDRILVTPEGNEQVKLDKKELDKITDEKKQEKKEKLDNYAKEVLEVLQRNGNRLTQKELREKVKGVGEAKISLIISELHALGKIKKIKQGRGNIIVFVEDQ